MHGRQKMAAAEEVEEQQLDGVDCRIPVPSFADSKTHLFINQRFEINSVNLISSSFQLILVIFNILNKIE